MNVLQLNSGNETGGGMFHILSLMKQLKKDIHITLGVFHEGELSKRARELGIPVKIFEQKSKFDVLIVKELKTFIENKHIDILHSHGARANFISFLLQRKIQFTWFITVHSDPFDDFLNQGIKGKIFTHLNLQAIKAADQILAISEQFRLKLLGLGIMQNKVITILNGIDFEVKPKEVYKRLDFGLSDNDFVMMMIARLEHVKRHETAFMAIHRVLKKKKNIHLLLIGHGSRCMELQEMARTMGIQNHVQFLGYRNDVTELLPLCDITLLTSQSESFPLVLLESARAKKPIIATDVGGVRLIVQDHKFGRIIQVGDVKDLAGKIEELYKLKENGKLQEMGDLLYAHARVRFSEEAFAQSVLKSYYKSTLLNHKEMYGSQSG